MNSPAIGSIGHNSAGRVRCIFRGHGDRAYTKLKNSFLQDRRISDETRGLVARLLSLPDDWEVTVQSIIASGKAGRDKVYRMIKEAEEFGYVKPEDRVRQADGTLGRQVYLVSDDPDALIARAAQELYEMEEAHPHPENPEVVEPVAEQQDEPRTEKPDLAKPRLAEPLPAEPDMANRNGKKNIEVNITLDSPPIVPPTLKLDGEPAPAKPKRSRNAVPDVYPHDFEEFWKVYPRREAKADACRAWERLKMPQKRRAYVALKSQLPMLEAKLRGRGGNNFCPLPATWINGGRFDDEPPEHIPEPAGPLTSHDDDMDRRKKLHAALEKYRG
jgi:hypothetical protein